MPNRTQSPKIARCLALVALPLAASAALVLGACGGGGGGTVPPGPVADIKLTFLTNPIKRGIEGAEYRYHAHAHSAVGPATSYALIDGPAGMLVDPPTGLVRWTPSGGQGGSWSVTVEAERAGTRVEQAFDVGVRSRRVVLNDSIVPGFKQELAGGAVDGGHLEVTAGGDSDLALPLPEQPQTQPKFAISTPVLVFSDDFGLDPIDGRYWLANTFRAGSCNVECGIAVPTVTAVSGGGDSGYVQGRVQVALTATTFGGAAMVRYLTDLNDGRMHVLNFRHERFNDGILPQHVDFHLYQITDGLLLESDWGSRPDGTWSPQFVQYGYWPGPYYTTSGVRFGQQLDYFLPDSATRHLYISDGLTGGWETWSVVIDPQQLTAVLYDLPDGAGNKISETTLLAGKPWYWRAATGTGTSSGFPAKDVGFRLSKFEHWVVDDPNRPNVVIVEIDPSTGEEQRVPGAHVNLSDDLAHVPLAVPRLPPAPVSVAEMTEPGGGDTTPVSAEVVVSNAEGGESRCIYRVISTCDYYTEVEYQLKAVKGQFREGERNVLLIPEIFSSASFFNERDGKDLLAFATTHYDNVLLWNYPTCPSPDLEAAARGLLGAYLADQARAAVSAFDLIGHGFGGLIGRGFLQGLYGLEDPGFVLPRVDLACLGTPHLAAGLDSSLDALAARLRIDPAGVDRSVQEAYVQALNTTVIASVDGSSGPRVYLVAATATGESDDGVVEQAHALGQGVFSDLSVPPAHRLTVENLTHDQLRTQGADHSVAGALRQLLELAPPLTGLADDFEVSPLSTLAWVAGGHRGSSTGLDQGTGVFSTQVVPAALDGYMQLQVGTPSTHSTNGAYAYLRSTHNLNNGGRTLINFTFEARVDTPGFAHADYHLIQFTDGDLQELSPFTLGGAWSPEFGQAGEGGGVPPLFDLPGSGTYNLFRSLGVPLSKRTWSAVVQADGTATLFDGPGGNGNIVGQQTLSLTQPWYLRFLVSAGTSSDRGAKDCSFRVYDFEELAEKPPAPDPTRTQARVELFSRFTPWDEHPFIVVTNESTDGAQITEMEMTIGNQAYNWDVLEDWEVRSGQVGWQVLAPSPNANQGVRVDRFILSFATGGADAFDPGDQIGFIADMDIDSADTWQGDFMDTLYNNGGLPNSQVTIRFSNGVALTGTMPDNGDGQASGGETLENFVLLGTAAGGP